MAAKLTQEEFIRRAICKHAGRYDYSKSIFTGVDNKVIIICKQHGEFEQQAYSHFHNGNGCPICSVDLVYAAATKRRLSIEEFIRRATLKHGNKYDYSEVEYTNGNSKVSVICPIHGVFHQVPNSHATQGCGCPICATSGFDPTKNAYLYLLMSSDFVKIGITNRNPVERAKRVSKSCGQVFSVVFTVQTIGSSAQEIEKKVLMWLKEKLEQPTMKFDGSTECFYQSDMPVQDIINKIEQLKEEENGD